MECPKCGFEVEDTHVADEKDCLQMQLMKCREDNWELRRMREIEGNAIKTMEDAITKTLEKLNNIVERNK